MHTDQENIKKLVAVIGDGQLSVKSMMDCIGLKGRGNFLTLYLNPAIQEGFVGLLYPDSDFLTCHHLYATVHHIYLVESGMFRY